MGTVKRSNLPWTEEEEKIIANCVKDNANNLQNAFRIAQTKLTEKGYTRTFCSIHARWYYYISKSDKVCFATVSRGHTAVNRKVTKQKTKIVGLWPKLKRSLKL